ncbi:hypothetical protein [Streptomyces albidocamelliae]|uniref:Uncharacterized protein n=1 Tax=Streptomyces albidocamelliae TaxID=2981135 RepID=A0ABY6EZX9_9ACTN|nr:hypothetical protein [Streptomyces sp. HUAS 14-6]UXY39924.1 hypothetical protein N8I86_37585 [Streptomyces sp. HUAS 14-6]
MPIPPKPPCPDPGSPRPHPPSPPRRTIPEDDLFWALCGGCGGNYGVVTALQFATEDTRDASLTRFVVTWPATGTATALQGWRAWNAEQPSDSGMPSLPT